MDFESFIHDTVASTVSMHAKEALYATTSRDAKEDWVVGIVETIPAPSTSAHTQSLPVLCDSTSNMDPSEHDDYSSMASADKSDGSLRVTIRRNAKTANVLCKSSRTGADPPDDDAVKGHRGINNDMVARAPVLCKVEPSKSSGFDLMSTSATSCSSALSIGSSTAKSNTQLNSNAMHIDALSNHSNQSMVPCSTHSRTKVSVLPDFDIISTGDRSELSVSSWHGNSQTELHRLSSSGEISIDATFNTSRDSIAPVYTMPQTMLQPNFDDVSMEIQSCSSSQFSLEGYYCAKPQVKSKRLSQLDGMSMDTSSHSTEWSMEGSIRQTFDSFKEKVSHAIADLNDDMYTVDTTSSLRNSERLGENAPIHRICGLDP